MALGDFTGTLFWIIVRDEDSYGHLEMRDPLMVLPVLHGPIASFDYIDQPPSLCPDDHRLQA